MLKPALRLLACLMPFVTGAFAADGGAAGFATKAAQAYMIEAATGTVLLAKNEDQDFSPASLAKLTPSSASNNIIQKARDDS